MSRPTRRVVLLIAALLALVLPAQPATGAPGGPKIVAGHRAGPVDLSGAPGSDVATLPLPRGTWLLFAKATVVQAQDDVVSCSLDGTISTDFSTSIASGTGPRQAAWAGFLRLEQPGQADLHCTRFGADVAQIARIRILAIRMGTVTWRRFDGGSSGTVGSGKPRARVGLHESGVSIPGASLGTIFSLALPAGRWWLIYKATFMDEAAGGGSAIDCRLEIGNTNIGFLADRGLDELADTDVDPMALQQTRRLPSKGRARVRCQATDASEAAFQRILAVEAGTLVSGPLGGRSTTSGRGNPVIRSGSRSGPVDVPTGSTFKSLGRLRLPPGKWAIVATGYARNGTGGADGALDCELTAGSDFDRLDDLELTGSSPYRRAPIVLAVVHTFAQQGSARLGCRSTGAALSAHSIRIVAIRGGTLSDLDL